MHHTTCKGPVQERRASEKQAWQARIDELARKLPAITPCKYIRHPITGELCEVR